MKKMKMVDNMNKNNDDTAIHGREQTPEILSSNLRILGQEVIEFSIENMLMAQSGFVKETNISIKPGNHRNAIGAIVGDNERQSFIEINKTVNILSLFYDVGNWELRLDDEYKIELSDMLLIEPRHLTKVDDFLRLLSTKMNKEDRSVYFRATEWYRYGINSKTLFNKFLAFYISIETLSDYYYEKYKSEIKMSKTERDECIKKYFEDLSITSISDITRENINNCHEKCLRISSKNKMKFAFEKGFEGKTDKIIEFQQKFFDEFDNDFYSIRNGIAHGSLSEYREADRTFVEENIHKIKYMAREFLIKTIS